MSIMKGENFMRNFVFEKIPKVYFGEGSLKQALDIELKKSREKCNGSLWRRIH